VYITIFVRASLQCSGCQVADQNKIKTVGAVPSFSDLYNCFMWLKIFSITMLGFFVYL
jgi:hypothetical protein